MSANLLAQQIEQNSNWIIHNLSELQSDDCRARESDGNWSHNKLHLLFHWAWCCWSGQMCHSNSWSWWQGWVATQSVSLLSKETLFSQECKDPRKRADDRIFARVQFHWHWEKIHRHSHPSWTLCDVTSQGENCLFVEQPSNLMFACGNWEEFWVKFELSQALVFVLRFRSNWNNVLMWADRHTWSFVWTWPVWMKFLWRFSVWKSKQFATFQGL